MENKVKSYLIDVPVRVNIWIRPESQKLQWDVIHEVRPSILFLVSDGGRNEDEWEKIYANRKMIDESIDWDCKVYRLYETINNGMYQMMFKARELIWSKVDRCIFLEDDHLPSKSYFRYCAELLEKYKDDERIECICGCNPLGEYLESDCDYFFSRQGCISGIASWKRVFSKYNCFDYKDSEYIMRVLKKVTKKNKVSWKRINAYSKYQMYEGHVAGTEFFIEFDMYAQNRLQIIPKYNMIKHLGCYSKSEHISSYKYLSKPERRFFDMDCHEIEFPLKHPCYVISDEIFEKRRNRCMAYGHPVVALYRKIIQAFKIIIHGDFKYLMFKIKRKKIKEK